MGERSRYFTIILPSTVAVDVAAKSWEGGRKGGGESRMEAPGASMRRGDEEELRISARNCGFASVDIVSS